jgi:hypothetical protein
LADSREKHIFFKTNLIPWENAVADEKLALLATIILLSVTIAISYPILQWIISLTDIFRVEPIQILHDSYIDSSNKILYLHVKNPSSVSIAIQAVEIVGFENIDSSSRFNRGNYMVPIIINPNTEKVISIMLSKDYVSGVIYQVKVYISTGGVYTALIQAK